MGRNRIKHMASIQEGTSLTAQVERRDGTCFKSQRYDIEASQLILKKLAKRRQTLAEAIAERNLYLRVSLVGYCNLCCRHCHNEGAPKSGQLELGLAVRVMRCAHDLGFRRVQFTGGEPLLHPQVNDFVREARRIFTDVGITSNGVFLGSKIDDLISVGVSRIHISIGMEAAQGRSDEAIPSTTNLLIALLKASARGINVRVNLPVLETVGDETLEFIENVLTSGCDVELFEILPISNVSRNHQVDMSKVLKRVQRVKRSSSGIKGRLIFRPYLAPKGLRCKVCDAALLCREKSRSLRLGADGFLRPCLASRRWDMALTQDQLEIQIERAAVFAIDYTW